MRSDTTPFVRAVLSGTIYFPAKRYGGYRMLEATLDRGEVIPLFIGTERDASRYAEFFYECKRWLTQIGEGRTPSFRRQDKTVRIHSGNSPLARIETAAMLLREKDYARREFDSCFEQGDGNLVAASLFNLSKQDPFLRDGITELGVDVLLRFKHQYERTASLPLFQASVS